MSSLYNVDHVLGAVVALLFHCFDFLHHFCKEISLPVMEGCHAFRTGADSNCNGLLLSWSWLLEPCQGSRSTQLRSLDRVIQVIDLLSVYLVLFATGLGSVNFLFFHNLRFRAILTIFGEVLSCRKDYVRVLSFLDWFFQGNMRLKRERSRRNV